MISITFLTMCRRKGMISTVAVSFLAMCRRKGMRSLVRVKISKVLIIALIAFQSVVLVGPKCDVQ